MAVTAATSCAVDVATTPTQTAWSSGATANTTGAATSPAAGVSAQWSAMCASEAPPRPVGAQWPLTAPRDPAEGPGDTPGILLVNSRCRAWEPACALPPLGSHQEQKSWPPWKEGWDIKGNRQD